MAANRREDSHRSGERVAVVLSGAAARGAFQAGALAEVVPALVAAGHEPTVFLGTSAGAINAALYGSYLHEGPVAAAESLTQVWARMSRRDVVAHPARSLLRAGWDFLRSAVDLGGGVESLFDTSPLVATAEEELDVDALAANVSAGLLEAVGAVAVRVPTAVCGGCIAAGRTVVFLDGSLPTEALNDPDRGVDVAPGPLGREQVIASAAIPVAFPPVWVPRPERARGWYVDGGTRLNTPVRPAVALGADRVVVIAAHSTSCPGPLPPEDPAAARGPVPDVADTAALTLHAVLADDLARDLVSLRDTGLPVMVASPEPGQLGRLARDVVTEELDRPWSWWRSTDDVVLSRLLRGAGDGPGREELLSYVLFDQTYFLRQLDLGRQAGRAALLAGWSSP